MLLAEGIVTEIVLDKKIFFVAVYRPHHISADDFKMFIQIVELLTDHMRDEKPHCIILLVILIADCLHLYLSLNT